MAGWEVSRHPEWDMMFAAGLTAREIADLCHQNVATVRSHLGKREKYIPGLRAGHEVALNARDPDRPSTRWRKKLDEVIRFRATYGRLPRRDQDEYERALFRWIAVQRRSYEAGHMSEAKSVLLNGVSGWSVNVHQRERDELWRSNLSNLQDYVLEFETMPHYKNFSTEHEHSLGVWLHRQHQSRAEQTLARWRLDALDETIPGWKSSM